ARLEARIERDVAEHVQQARAAVAREAYLEARRHYLAALALEPTNMAAFEGLRNDVKEVRFVTHTVRAGESLGSIAQRYYGDRSRSEVIWEVNQLPRNPKLAAGVSLRVPEIPGVPFYVTPREGGAAEPPRDEDTGDLARQARSGLVQDRYNEGLRLYREERLEQAIVQWRAVLELDPRHPNARKNIEQAEQILKKLEERSKR